MSEPVMEDLTRIHPQAKLLLNYLIHVAKNLELITALLPNGEESGYPEQKKLLDMIVMRSMTKGFFPEDFLDPPGTHTDKSKLAEEQKLPTEELN
jgi:hypothetical protein